MKKLHDIPRYLYSQMRIPRQLAITQFDVGHWHCKKLYRSMRHVTSTQSSLFLRDATVLCTCALRYTGCLLKDAKILSQGGVFNVGFSGVQSFRLESRFNLKLSTDIFILKAKPPLSQQCIPARTEITSYWVIGWEFYILASLGCCHENTSYMYHVYLYHFL